MSQLDVTGFGTIVNLVADVTFPAGIVITQFSNDADPLDMAAVKIADTAMGVNGDLIRWARAVPLPMVLNVVPGSADDQNLAILADNNRASQGKVSAGDVITANVIYPDGSVVTLIGGVLTDAVFGKGISGEGRLKTKAYSLMFSDKIGS